jgi:hypothetical protein
MARGTSIVDLAIGSVAALGQRELRSRESQVPDILYFLGYLLNFHDHEIAASSSISLLNSSDN